MRIDIIPQLEKTFGKGIKKNLCQLAEESEEIKKYLTKKTGQYLKDIIYGPFGALLDMNENMPSEIVEIKHLIRTFLVFQGERGVTRNIIEQISDALYKGLAHKTFRFKEKKIVKIYYF